MPKHRKLLVVLADGEHVRFVRPAVDNALHDDTLLDAVSAHKKPADLGSDRPGASFHTGSSAHHVLAPRHDLHDLAKEKFARTVADQLNAAAAAEKFDELVIVAPAHSLATIREHLNPATAAKIVGALQKDLVKTPNHELWPHVRTWVQPVRRAAS